MAPAPVIARRRMCNTGGMPSLRPKSKASVSTRWLTVDFADDASGWLRDINQAVQSNPDEIRVQFIGGCITPPFEIIALRNALLQIPEHIRVITIATCSLPPLGCAAWLVGDERHIARDAVVWIPRLPEHVLREGQRGALCHSNTKEGSEFNEESEEDDNSGEDSRSRRRDSSTMSSSKKYRIDFDLRTIADALNQWFPSWEFSGSCLDFDDLLAWEVVRPEWGFGGRAVRSRQPQAVQPRSKRGVKKSEVIEAQSPVKKPSEEVQAPKPDVSLGELPMPTEEA